MKRSVGFDDRRIASKLPDGAEVSAAKMRSAAKISELSVTKPVGQSKSEGGPSAEASAEDDKDEDGGEVEDRQSSGESDEKPEIRRSGRERVRSQKVIASSTERDHVAAAIATSKRDSQHQPYRPEGSRGHPAATAATTATNATTAALPSLWSAEEDSVLTRMVVSTGAENWREKASGFPTNRSLDALRNRWKILNTLGASAQPQNKRNSSAVPNAGKRPRVQRSESPLHGRGHRAPMSAASNTSRAAEMLAQRTQAGKRAMGFALTAR
jgi:hypothetical protein